MSTGIPGPQVSDLTCMYAKLHSHYLLCFQGPPGPPGLKGPTGMPGTEGLTVSCGAAGK